MQISALSFKRGKELPDPVLKLSQYRSLFVLLDMCPLFVLQTLTLL